VAVTVGTGSGVHQEQTAVSGRELEATGVDSAVRTDRSARATAVAIEPEPPARRGIRPLGVGLPAERRPPGSGRRFGPAGRWIESMHGRPFRIPQETR
jgi:hypothetical protein